MSVEVTLILADFHPTEADLFGEVIVRCFNRYFIKRRFSDVPQPDAGDPGRTPGRRSDSEGGVAGVLHKYVP